MVGMLLVYGWYSVCGWYWAVCGLYVVDICGCYVDSNAVHNMVGTWSVNETSFDYCRP